MGGGGGDGECVVKWDEYGVYRVRMKCNQEGRENIMLWVKMTPVSMLAPEISIHYRV